MSSSLSEVFQTALNEYFSGKGGTGTVPNPLELLSVREAFLPRIHYSWYEETFSKLSPLENALLKTALPPQIAEKLKLEGSSGLTLFSSKLAKVMGLYEHPPLALLEKGPFFSLLEFDKENLTELISLLPLPVLAPQVKKIVDNKRLLKLYGLLSETQKGLLKQTLLRPELGTFTGFDLSAWTGTTKELEIELHRIGIQLLYQAVSGEGASFCFYLSRILDRGRGRVFLEGSKATHAKDPKNLLIAVIKYLFNQRKPRVISKT